MEVSVRGTDVLWNGEKLSSKVLRHYSKRVAKMAPRPWILFDFDLAKDCAHASRLRDALDREFDCQGKGICGQGSPKAWREAPSVHLPTNMLDHVPAPNGWRTVQSLDPHETINVLAVRGDALLWNDQPISRATLRTYLARLADWKDGVRPRILVDLTRAIDERLATGVLDEVDRIGKCADGPFCMLGPKPKWMRR